MTIVTVLGSYRPKCKILRCNRGGAQDWQVPFQGLQQMVAQLAGAISTISPSLAQFQECILREQRKVLNERCEAQQADLIARVEEARKETREHYLASQQSVANTLRQVQILQDCLQSSAVGEHMARVQTAQVTQNVAEQVARIERELSQARRSPNVATPSAEEVARKLQENMLQAQRLQDTFAQAQASHPRVVPSANSQGASGESGAAIWLDPLEGEEEEGEISLSRSALMYMPPHLIPKNLKDSTGNLRKVRAIGSGGNTTVMPLHGDLISMEIAKGTKAPFFDPQADAWEDFEIDWEIHWDKISQGKRCTDQTKLQAFEPCLSPQLRDEVRLLRIQGDKVGFSQVFAQFKARYGPGRHLGARKRWYDVTLPNAGKVTREEWHNFWIQFCTASHNVRDATPEEASRLILGRVPAFIAGWIIEEQEKKSQRKPVVRVTAVSGLTADAVKDSFTRLTGYSPIAVEIKGGGEYHLTFASKVAVEETLKLVGRKLSGTNKALGVELVEQTMPVHEIYELVSQKLAIRDKRDLVQSMRDFPAPKGGYGRRYVSKVRDESEPEDDISEAPTPKVARDSPKRRRDTTPNRRPRSQSRGKRVAAAEAQGQSPARPPPQQQPAPQARQDQRSDSRSGNWSGSNNGAGPNENPRRNPSSGQCFNCGRSGHMSRECRSPRRFDGACFRCGNTGHMARNCSLPDTREKPSMVASHVAAGASTSLPRTTCAATGGEGNGAAASSSAQGGGALLPRPVPNRGARPLRWGPGAPAIVPLSTSNL